MDEIGAILRKYNENYIDKYFNGDGSLNEFTIIFFKDTSNIFDAITRIRNTERNPVGFDLNDAPILGLLIKTWKLLKESIKYYEQNNAEIISVLERPMIEACVVATYLLQEDKLVIEDYRKCSYKDRLRILRDLENGSPFFETKAGKRLLSSVQKKMEEDNFSVDSFSVQKKNKWKLQGKTFYDIFSHVHDSRLYSCTYGMMSESIHGSWNESIDFDLIRNDGGTYSAFPFSQNADIRFVSPTLRFTTIPFKLWLQRIEVNDPSLLSVLDWIERVNVMIFCKFDETYDG